MTYLIFFVGALAGIAARATWQEWIENKKQEVRDAYMFAGAVDRQTDELLRQKAEKMALERYNLLIKNTGL